MRNKPDPQSEVRKVLSKLGVGVGRDWVQPMNGLLEEAESQILKLISEARIEGKAELLDKGSWHGNGWFISIAYLHPKLQKCLEALQRNKKLSSTNSEANNKETNNDD